MSEIKPVPCRMCGGPAKKTQLPQTAFIKCGGDVGCDIEGPTGKTMADAVNDWNALMQPASQPDDDLRHRYIMAALTGLAGEFLVNDVQRANLIAVAVNIGTETYELAMKK